MNTKQLSYIITIAECESLSAAAEKLQVSQPALSKYLIELETELGMELFIRHKKHLYLNNAGHIYVDAARKIIEVKEQTYSTIDALSGRSRKQILIGGTPLRGAMAVAHVFSAFQRRYPDTQLIFREQYSADLRQSVINQSIDLALGTTLHFNHPELTYLSAHKEELVLFVPSFHPLASRAFSDLEHLESIDIREFQDTPFVTGSTGTTIRTIFDSITAQAKIHPTIVFESDNNLLLKNMVTSGSGICILPLSHADLCREIVHFSLQPKTYAHLSVMVPKGKELSEEERYLIALIFASEYGHSHYHFHPTPAAKQILEEFGFYFPEQHGTLRLP